MTKPWAMLRLFPVILVLTGCATEPAVPPQSPDDAASPPVGQVPPPREGATTQPGTQATAAGTQTTATGLPTGLAGTAIKFTGGDGSSMEKAIVIEGALNESEGVGTEYDYLDLLFGPQGSGWQLEQQSLLSDKGRYYDEMAIVHGGVQATYYFDITAFFGKW
jgi:hypothetical protein